MKTKQIRLEYLLMILFFSNIVWGQNEQSHILKGNSRIVLIRPSAIASDLTGYKIYDNDKNLLTKLRVGRPFTKIVPSGELVLTSKILRKTTFKTILEPNKTYIIKFTIDGSIFLDKPLFRVVKVEDFYNRTIKLDSL